MSSRTALGLSAPDLSGLDGSFRWNIAVLVKIAGAVFNYDLQGIIQIHGEATHCSVQVFKNFRSFLRSLNQAGIASDIVGRTIC